jgi:hypothetical protein
MNADDWKCVVERRAGKYELNKVDDGRELDIKKGKHSGTYNVSFRKDFFVLCKKT